MWRSMMTNGCLLALAILLLLGGSIFAQDVTIVEPTETPILTATPLPTETPTEAIATISVSGIDPTGLVQGMGGVLTISGANFTSSTTVALNGTLPLALTSQSAGTLTALIGSDVAAGVYSVVVSDPNGGAQTAATTLTVIAPTATIAPTAIPQLTVTQTEPTQITTGQSGTLSILGANFSASTTVRLVGFGFLSTTFVNSGALTAALPASIPTGSYTIEVADPTYGTASAPGSLTVVPAAATTAPVITTTATPTATAIPGQPRLVINTFSANPSSIYPGGTTQFTIEVYNVGSRTAEGVVISLGDSKFTPANGQASVTLPDLPAMTSYVVTFSVTAPADAAEGPQSIALVLTSRDFSGQTYTNNASVSVNVLATPTGTSQVILDSYVVEPSTAAPGDTVTLRALFRNTGTDTAEQVLIQLEGTNGVLIAGSDGNAFAVGDMPAGAGAAVVMTFVVSSGASSGAQSQALTISYQQDGEAKQNSASISLTVETVTTPTPLLLLQSYSTGQTDALQPGQQFALEMTIQNAGAVDVSNLLVTFGTVSTESSSASGTTSATQASPSTTTTTASADFAIYGSGGTLLLGDLAAGNTVSLTQDFIVSSDLTSGIQDLPITLQYISGDGTETQQTLSASLLVVVLPRVRITAANTLDDPLTADEEYSLSLDIANLGDAQVVLTEMRVTGDNAEISEGAEAALDPLQSDDDSTQSVTFVPQVEGAYTITVEVDYVDDLNRTQTITQTFSGQVEAAAQTTFQPRGAPPMIQTTEDGSTRIGRLLLGFLGFGG